eukprot:2527572-Prymnesium_polylepis.1
MRCCFVFLVGLASVCAWTAPAAPCRQRAAPASARATNVRLSSAANLALEAAVAVSLSLACSVIVANTDVHRPRRWSNPVRPPRLGRGLESELDGLLEQLERNSESPSTWMPEALQDEVIFATIPIATVSEIASVPELRAQLDGAVQREEYFEAVRLQAELDEALRLRRSR